MENRWEKELQGHLNRIFTIEDWQEYINNIKTIATGLIIENGLVTGIELELL